MQTDIPEKDYTTRRGELSAYGRAVNSSRLLRYLLVSFAVVTVALLVYALLLIPSSHTVARIVIVLGIATLVTGYICIWRISKEHFVDPDLAFRKWLQQVCDGELDARIELPDSHRHYKELDFHTRNLASALRQLSSDMESLVATQTQRLENQNRVVELLFQVTSDVAGELDLPSVLDTVCTHLSSWLSDAKVAAYLVESVSDGEGLKLKATSVADKRVFAADRPLADLPHARDSSVIIPSVTASTEQCLKIPIYKLKTVTGMVEVIVAKEQDLTGVESQRIFQTVSEQLSMFVARESALESAHNASLIRERNELGAEIHDSLAQTLLAARYQTSLLRETLQKTTPVYNDLVRIENMIDEANVEVRGLIGEYRKPLTEHRYTDTIQNVIDEFNRDSPIEVFFQLDNPNIRFTAREDSVIERIVRESLVNAKKYSEASMIRVYVHDEPSGVRSVLIEDDGVGFCNELASQDSLLEATAAGCTRAIAGATGAQQAEKNTGDHIGLSIMRDRALTIGAILTIDSEPGEGTRVFLKLPPLALSEED